MTEDVTNVAAIYCRVSSDLQDEGSLDSQRRKCQEYAKQHGLSVPDELIFEDMAASGRTAKREAYQTLISAAQSKPAQFSTILVWKFSRLGRNREESVLVKGLLRRHGVCVKSVSEPVDTETSHGKLLEGILESLDEFYSANLGVETRRGQEQANANGFFTGGRAPYGYTTTKIPDPAGKRGKGGGIAMRTVLVIDDVKARAVKDIFLWSSQGIGLLSIADRLNQAGVPVPDRAKGFSTSTIRSILHNETYLGRLIYNKQRFFKKPDGKHCKRDNPRTEWHIKKMPDLRIIEDDVWQTVHERFAKRKKNGATTNARTNRYALSGLIGCSCGAKFTAHKTMRKGHQYVTYRCGANRRSGSAVCASEVRIKQEQLMEAVCAAFDKKILNPECEAKIIAYVEKMITESKGDYGARKEVMESEIKTLTKEIEQLVKIASITDGDLKELAKDMNAKSKRREVVREALSGLETLVQDTLLDDLPAKVRAELSSVRLVLEGADPQALHAELQKHIDTINVDLEGLITIKGSLSGALKSVLKLVAGARYSLQHRWLGWVCFLPDVALLAVV